MAGSVGPLGISADEAADRGIDRVECFREQIAALLEEEVDLIFFETFMSFEEMEIALRAKPPSDRIVVSLFACEPEGRLESGQSLVDAFARCHDLGASIVGANCLNGPHAMVMPKDAMFIPPPGIILRTQRAKSPRKARI